MAEGLQRPEGVNISKGQVRVECVERSHVAAENTREHRRMLRMKFYVTDTLNKKSHQIMNITLLLMARSACFILRLLHFSHLVMNVDDMACGESIYTA